MPRPSPSREAHNLASSWRIPDNAPPELAEIAARALQRIVEVMDKPERNSRDRLDAAKRVRDEVCGLLAQRTELSGGGGQPMAVSIRIGVPQPGDATQPQTPAAALPAPKPVPPRRRRRVALREAGAATEASTPSPRSPVAAERSGVPDIASHTSATPETPDAVRK